MPVKISAPLSHTGTEYERTVLIDSCIADIVAALQSAGINMLASCCGHGKGLGRIDLADGRIIQIIGAGKK